MAAPSSQEIAWLNPEKSTNKLIYYVVMRTGAVVSTHDMSAAPVGLWCTFRKSVINSRQK